MIIVKAPKTRRLLFCALPKVLHIRSSFQYFIIMDNIKTDQLTNLDLEIDEGATEAFSSAIKWTRFISIVVFCFCGLLFFAFLAGGSDFIEGFNKGLQKYNGSFFGLDGTTLLIGIIAVIIFVAVVYYFLFNFSAKTKNALVAENTGELGKGLKSLKIYFILYSAFSAISILLMLYSIIESF